MQYTSLKYSSCTFNGVPDSDKCGNYIACSLNFAHPEWVGTFFEDENNTTLLFKELTYAEDSEGHVISCKYYY